MNKMTELYQSADWKAGKHMPVIEGPVYTHHSVVASMKIEKSGTLFATSLCNVHGLWENSQEIKAR